jgi:S-formylglutathione hydrolase FrmB
VPPDRIPRRAILAAGAAAAVAAAGAGGYELVASGALPGKYRLAQLDGACGAPPPPPRGPLPAAQETTFRSAYRHTDVTMVTLLPAGVPAPSVPGIVVALHGLGEDARSAAALMAPAMAAAGSRLAVVTVDGGRTYWHRRADGDDPVGMIVHEVLPRLAGQGLPAGLLTVAGWSMGGYGALLLAGRLPVRPAGVAVLAPAIYASYADARQADRRSFDGPADFAGNDVFSRISALRQVPCYVVCGDNDPFERMDVALRADLARQDGHAPAGGITGGCHDNAFWARHLPGALAFLGARY